jgi:uncharacterized protein (TIGR03067 family)
MNLKSMVIYAVLILPHAGTLATTLAVADTKDDATKEEMKRLEGTWTVTSAKYGDFALPEITIGAITIKGEKWIWQFKDGKEKTSTFKIDPNQKPKTIDLAGGLIEEKEAVPGIYVIDGDDLRVCFSGEDAKKPQKRPENFEGKGKAVFVFELHRKK